MQKCMILYGRIVLLSGIKLYVTVCVTVSCQLVLCNILMYYSKNYKRGSCSKQV